MDSIYSNYRLNPLKIYWQYKDLYKSYKDDEKVLKSLKKTYSNKEARYKLDCLTITESDIRYLYEYDLTFDDFKDMDFWFYVNVGGRDSTLFYTWFDIKPYLLLKLAKSKKRPIKSACINTSDVNDITYNNFDFTVREFVDSVDVLFVEYTIGPPNKTGVDNLIRFITTAESLKKKFYIIVNPFYKKSFIEKYAKIEPLVVIDNLAYNPKNGFRKVSKETLSGFRPNIHLVNEVLDKDERKLEVSTFTNNREIEEPEDF